MALRLASVQQMRRFLKPQQNQLAVTSRPIAINAIGQGFTFAGMKKNPAVIPLVVIITGAMIGVCGYIAYAIQTRTDVNLMKTGFKSEKIDVMHPEKNKLWVLNQKYEANPRLAEALSYKDEEAKKD